MEVFVLNKVSGGKLRFKKQFQISNSAGKVSLIRCHRSF